MDSCLGSQAMKSDLHPGYYKLNWYILKRKISFIALKKENLNKNSYYRQQPQLVTTSDSVFQGRHLCFLATAVERAL